MLCTPFENLDNLATKIEKDIGEFVKTVYPIFVSNNWKYGGIFDEAYVPSEKNLQATCVELANMVEQEHKEKDKQDHFYCSTGRIAILAMMFGSLWYVNILLNP